ncbi:MAG: acyltransferase [Anaerolineales bacterium]|nr:acyltransferase [Anaerolineales bacterium]
MQPTKKIYSLQVYRAIAAILVVLYHITDLSQTKFDYTFLGDFFSFGHTGVDFFFILSGFIILYVHGQDIGQPKQIKRYLTKRFIRLYPIYWCIASVKILIILLMPSFAKSYETDSGYLIKSLLLIPQWPLPIIGAAWTLSYEILFYLLFGVAILVGTRWTFKLAIVWTLAIGGVLITNSVSEPMFGRNLFVYFLLNERNLEFILGCLAAFTVLNTKVKYSKTIAVAGGTLFVLFGWCLSQGWGVFSFALTFGLASFLLVVGSASIEMRHYIRWPKLLVFLGDASYSIYLTHAMFFNIFLVILPRLGLMSYLSPFWVAMIMVAAGITGGSFVYLLVEKPLIYNLRKKLLTPLKFGLGF